MPFISYAQNFEDVMLWRALKHVKNGTYVDVGAQHPLIDSVSKAFYDHGWRGIHIEPVQQYADLLRLERPDETILQVALGEDNGTLEFEVINDTGLSTGVKKYAESHTHDHDFHSETVIVPLLTISSALQFLKNQPIHWLKIDVEGFEQQVLKGWNSQILRPWIMVIEATEPLSTEPKHQQWESILTEANYIFVYFDGLNRFYVAQEHANLIDAFSSPPNVFDAARLSGLMSAEWCRGLIEQHHLDIMEKDKHIKQLESEIVLNNTALQNYRTKISQLEEIFKTTINQQQNLETKVQDLNQISHNWYIQAIQANQKIQEIFESHSWQFTKPLRFLSRLTQSPKHSTKQLIQKTGTWLLSKPSTRTLGLKIYKALPNRTQNTIKNLIKGNAIDHNAEININPAKLMSINDLSPDAKVIYKKLISASTGK
ncbi:hypothetical protein DTO96_100942 [Ephemeroptericola cinctiostellae]|uniref:Methyltransferase FkbM domain-containing protein n=1 Tax=Ephemeroptericola cinctiostellae TaxID=2268024 RepID=A0A345DA28_9BURK|nr:FkbM family methyltransferase [Ephemeroptericola cinctiostellae]AXF85216.1 hypothetical protein DTO96_100942 [Ephemeroptericola cinctiostellae]